MTNFKEICFAQFAACSYEGFLFGWKIDESNNDDESDIHLEAKQIFGFNCGAGQLKCLTSSSTGKYLVAGGNDERVHIFNVEEKKSLGELAQHKGAITKLSFYQDSHLFSASEVCNIYLGYYLFLHKLDYFHLNLRFGGI